MNCTAATAALYTFRLSPTALWQALAARGAAGRQQAGQGQQHHRRAVPLGPQQATQQLLYSTKRGPSLGPLCPAPADLQRHGGPVPRSSARGLGRSTTWPFKSGGSGRTLPAAPVSTSPGCQSLNAREHEAATWGSQVFQVQPVFGGHSMFSHVPTPRPRRWLQVGRWAQGRPQCPLFQHHAPTGVQGGQPLTIGFGSSNHACSPAGAATLRESTCLRGGGVHARCHSRLFSAEPQTPSFRPLVVPRAVYMAWCLHTTHHERSAWLVMVPWPRHGHCMGLGIAWGLPGPSSQG